MFTKRTLNSFFHYRIIFINLSLKCGNYLFAYYIIERIHMKELTYVYSQNNFDLFKILVRIKQFDNHNRIH
jgi:hypothetical protein